MPLKIRRLLLVLGSVLLLGACRLDVTVDMVMNADGTGEVVVVASVDADVVAQVPGLSGSLRLDDAAAAGWLVEGPAPTEDGGIALTLRHPFASAAEATNLLNSLGQPFTGVVIERTATDDDITVTMNGSLTLTNGFDGFADSALLQSVGATPFRAQLDASGATPQESMSVEFSWTAPGDIAETSGDRADGGVRWSAPLDGSTSDLATRAVLAPESGSSWAGPVSTVALILLAVWLVAGVALVVLVGRARSRRNQRPVRFR